jgi:hypothetical protein
MAVSLRETSGRSALEGKIVISTSLTLQYYVLYASSSYLGAGTTIPLSFHYVYGKVVLADNTTPVGPTAAFLILSNNDAHGIFSKNMSKSILNSGSVLGS